MGVVKFLYHPDTVLTASDLENLALGLLSEIPIPGVEDCAFDSGIIHDTLLHAAVEQDFIKAITDATRNTNSDDYTLTQLHTIDPTELGEIVNRLPAEQATMILGPLPRIICLDFIDIHYHGCPYYDPAELCHTTPRDGTSQCHRYLAAITLCPAKPLIVAVTPVRSDEPTSDAVDRVIDRFTALPFEVDAVLADRGFANAASIQRLQTTSPVILPVIRRGKRLAEKLETRVSYWTEYVMYAGSEPPVRFPLAVCVFYQQEKRGKHLVRAYAACEQGARTPKEVERLYRKRSAIETSFRTMQEARARTTTPDPVWFRFKVFRRWIAHSLDERFGRLWEAPTNGVGIPSTYPELDAG
ncbi:MULTISPECIES: transposase [Haloarcula]|uniref:transposase n=1 Tax=Haloarcula TaxID=2237 RepID=UPI0023ECB75E|nr:transposase [Halomicroarcula sp. XH51]